MAAEYRILTVGESMGLFVNDVPGPLHAATAHSLSFGGAESNVAIALSRLGVHATWCSRLGSDPVGDLIARELRAEGVTVRAVRDERRPTGLMHRHRRTSHLASVHFWRRGSAASALSYADVADALTEDVDLVHLTGILPGLSESTEECALALAEHSRAMGIAVSFDVNYRAQVWREKDPIDVLRRLVAYADIVFAGDEEAALLVGPGEPMQLAQRLHQLGPREVIVKLGGEGSIALVDGLSHTQPAYPVGVVDTVGAGDAFVAGYLASRAAHAPTARRLEIAAAAGAFACTVPGDWEGAPTEAEIIRMSHRESVTR